MNGRAVMVVRLASVLALQLALLRATPGEAAQQPAPKPAEKPAETAAEVGPAPEKRFPPLVVPDGFVSTLFACDPLVEYPSVISIGPRPGTLLVAHD